MKKMMVAVLVMALSVFAMEMKGLGLKAGLNMANLAGDDAGDDNVMAMTYAVGAFGEFGINDMFDFQPELLYTVKGCNIDVSGVDAGIRLAYLEIPMLAKINFAKESQFKPFFLVGPAIGLNMSAIVFVDDTDSDLDDVAGMEFALVVGAGMSFDKFTFDARYNMGLTTIDDSDAEADVKTSTIQIMVGYKFM
jgi:hypothetical protein